MSSRQYRTNDVARCCENKLGMRLKGKNHLNAWFRLDGKRVARITVPKGRKDIAPKTYASMAKQLRLTRDEFGELLACPLSLADYRGIVRGRAF